MMASLALVRQSCEGPYPWKATVFKRGLYAGTLWGDSRAHVIGLVRSVYGEEVELWFKTRKGVQNLQLASAKQ